MTGAELAQVHEQVRKTLAAATRAAPPGVQAVHALVEVVGDFPADDQAAFAECASPWGHEGWLRFRSAVVWSAAADPALLGECGPPIAGEWWDGATSFRLIAHPAIPGRSLVLAVRELAAPEMDDLLAEEGSLLGVVAQDMMVLAAAAGGVAPPRPRLSYRVYFRVGPGGALTRAFDAFRGFSD